LVQALDGVDVQSGGTTRLLCAAARKAAAAGAAAADCQGWFARQEQAVNVCGNDPGCLGSSTRRSAHWGAGRGCRRRCPRRRRLPQRGLLRVLWLGRGWGGAGSAARLVPLGGSLACGPQPEVVVLLGGWQRGACCLLLLLLLLLWL
jgi:hypothetical protein